MKIKYVVVVTVIGVFLVGIACEEPKTVNPHTIETNVPTETMYSVATLVTGSYVSTDSYVSSSLMPTGQWIG
jgi:hypothetical protein